MGLYELWPKDNADQVRGPYAAINYIRPMIIFGGGLLLFTGGMAMFLGALTRQPVVVFAIPTIMLVGGLFFVWSFSPDWLSPSLNRLMQLLDPAAMRWMIESFTKENRSAEFYNTATVNVDSMFAVSRVLFAACGLAGVVGCAPLLKRRLRGTSPKVELASIPAAAVPGVISELHSAGPMPVATRSEPGLIATTLAVFRTELRFLLRSPGIWIFGPLILLQVFGTASLRVGPLDTTLLATPGSIASMGFNTLTLLLILLILYYTVESLVREERRGMAGIVNATAAPTAALLSGKVLANAVMATVIVIAAFLGALIVLVQQAVQDKVWVGIEPGVFGLIWVALLAPTLMFWSAFVTVIYALVRNRYATYGVALAALIGTGFATSRGVMNWASLWHLWSGVNWSELDRLAYAATPILWNRVLVLLCTVFLVALALRIWPRRIADARGVADRLSAGRLVRASIVPLCIAAPAAVLVITMLVKMRNGSEGGPQERLAKDYWRQNDLTWRGSVAPAIDRVVADVDVRPESRSFAVKGEYVLRNASGKTVSELALTVRPHLKVSQWTLEGAPIEPVKVFDPTKLPALENRSGLIVIHAAKPLAPDATLRIGFELTGGLPDGWSKRSTGASEFVLESGVVLTSFSGSFLPYAGYAEDAGTDEATRRDPKEYPLDHYTQKIDPEFGSAWPTQVEMKVTGPEAWTINAVGIPGEAKIEAGRKTVEWKTDHPVRFFNLVGGPLVETKGKVTSIFHSPRHDYRTQRMAEMLDAARTYYSQWFHPYPWRDLKITEFPGVATYAQGFPGNISFSEGIGFLTKNDEETEHDLADFVVAHESAHQWWGNIVTPGKGPGGNVLSEGMANFASALLIEQVRGEGARRSLMRQFEVQYGRTRSKDNERPLHRVTGARPGDTTIMYDRGGWVLWMLCRHLGRERMFEGLQAFTLKFKDGPDYPLMEDLVETLRPFAADAAAYDMFVNQWVLGSAAPEFVFEGVTKQSLPDGTWKVTGTLRNVATGDVTVEIAARDAEAAKPAKASVDEAAAGAAWKAPVDLGRVSVRLAPGGESAFEVICSGEPAEVLADPDITMLQIGRKRATAPCEPVAEVRSAG
jgi:hypothetical protein